MPKLKAVPDDTETLATKAKVERQEKCSKEVNAVLEKHKCELHVLVHLTDRTEPLRNILNLPVTLAVLSK